MKYLATIKTSSQDSATVIGPFDTQEQLISVINVWMQTHSGIDTRSIAISRVDQSKPTLTA